MLYCLLYVVKCSGVCVCIAIIYGVCMYVIMLLYLCMYIFYITLARKNGLGRLPEYNNQSINQSGMR